MSGIVPQLKVPITLPPKGKSLNDYTWEEINNISKAGKAREYFSVGDRKAITINGTVGTQSLNTTLYAYIIGFDHNGATNTIDFGTFKSDLSGGKDMAFKDGKYDGYSTDGTKYYNMSHWSNANYGGWKGSDLRYDILGSTDVAPSTYGSSATSGRTGSDATSTCATNPVPNTLMAALPVDLRAVMKPMTIYTDNVSGDASDPESDITASIDYLPLLSEFEILGKRVQTSYHEQNYQKQYEYFISGNSVQKYRFGASSNTCKWWTRSLCLNSTMSFAFISTNGSSTSGGARQSYGIAPIFRV